MQRTTTYLCLTVEQESTKVSLHLFRSATNTIVMTMEPTSIMDAYALMKVARQDKLSENINVVLNMVRSDEQGHKIFENLQKFHKTTYTAQ